MCSLRLASGCSSKGQGTRPHCGDSDRAPVDVGRQRGCIHRLSNVEHRAKEQHLSYPKSSHPWFGVSGLRA